MGSKANKTFNDSGLDQSVKLMDDIQFYVNELTGSSVSIDFMDFSFH